MQSLPFAVMQVIASGALSAVAMPALAQTAGAAAEPMSKVIITGSNIKRTSVEGSSPVTTLTKKDIAQTGAVSVADLMSKLPALGSSNQVDSRDGGFSKGLATASMRGLGSASTLILLNGRRISPAAYADPNAGQSTQYDLNSIPLSAIERVEILKDGASAVYGSDAIAGVINFITKSDYRGTEISTNASATDQGKFKRSNVSAAYGFGDLDTNGYNAFMAVDLTQRARTALSDAHVRSDEYRATTGRLSSFGSSASGRPLFYKESRLGSGSFNRFVSADLSCDPSEQRTGSTDLVPMLASDPLIGNKFCNYDTWAFEDAQGKSDSRSALARAEFKLGGGVSAFAEAAYSRSMLEYSGAPRTISGRSLSTVFPKDGAGTSFRPVLGVNHPDNPTRGTAGAVPVAVVYRFVGTKGGSENTNTSTRLLTGLKGSNMGWDWDTGLLYNKSERLQYQNGFVHKPTVERLYTQNIPLATIARDPNAIRNISLRGESDIAQFDLKGSTEFGQLGGGKIGLATGVEFKRETMNIVPDDLSVAGQIVGIANQYSDASRKVGSAFLEVRTPFTNNFEMEWAARFDKYQGFDASTTPKVGAKWTVSPTVAVRGTFSTGFRAPSLTQMVDGGTQYFLNNFVDKLRCEKPGAESLDCAKSLSGVASANKELEPEKARSFTLGLVMSPTSNFDVLLDFYRIKKKKEVDLLDATSVLQNPKYADRVKRDQNQGTWLTDPATGRLIPNSGPLISIATPYVNAGGTDTSGIDMELAMRNSLGDAGKISTRLTTSYMLRFKKAQNAGDPAFDLVGTSGGTAYDLTSVGELPRWKSTLSSTWTRGDHTLTGTANFVSGISYLAKYSIIDDAGTIGAYDPAYCEYGRPGVQPNYSKFYPECSTHDFTTLDVAYSYAWSKQLTLGMNIQNLFDTKSPYDPSFGTAGYNTSMHSATGRYFTVKASYKF